MISPIHLQHLEFRVWKPLVRLRITCRYHHKLRLMLNNYLETMIVIIVTSDIFILHSEQHLSLQLHDCQVPILRHSHNIYRLLCRYLTNVDINPFS